MTEERRNGKYGNASRLRHNVKTSATEQPTIKRPPTNSPTRIFRSSMNRANALRRGPTSGTCSVDEIESGTDAFIGSETRISSQVVGRASSDVTGRATGIDSGDGRPGADSTTGSPTTRARGGAFNSGRSTGRSRNPIRRFSISSRTRSAVSRSSSFRPTRARISRCVVRSRSSRSASRPSKARPQFPQRRSFGHTGVEQSGHSSCRLLAGRGSDVRDGPPRARMKATRTTQIP